MNALQELNVEEALQAAFEAGFNTGYEAGVAAGRYSQTTWAHTEAKKPDVTQKAEAQIKMINAVGQTLDTQARLLQGLASALDSWR